MPVVPLVWPSLMPMVLKTQPIMPAASTPFFTCDARSLRCMLHGLESNPVLAMPTWALPMSSRLRPAAYSWARAPGCEMSSVRRALTRFSFTSFSMSLSFLLGLHRVAQHAEAVDVDLHAIARLDEHRRLAREAHPGRR